MTREALGVMEVMVSAQAAGAKARVNAVSANSEDRFMMGSLGCICPIMSLHFSAFRALARIAAGAVLRLAPGGTETRRIPRCGAFHPKWM
jgi:hypothetical protein